MIHVDPEEIVYVGEGGSDTVLYEGQGPIRYLGLRGGLDVCILDDAQNRLTLVMNRPEVEFDSLVKRND